MISRLFFGLFCALAFVACDDDLLTINRSFDGAAVTFDVPPSADGEDFSIQRENIEVDLQRRLDEYGISEDRLKSASVESVRAYITDPSGELTFDDIETATLTLTAAGLESVVVASVPAGATGDTTMLDIVDLDIKSYLLLPSFDASFIGRSTDGVGDQVQVTVEATYDIEGGL